MAQAVLPSLLLVLVSMIWNVMLTCSQPTTILSSISDGHTLVTIVEDTLTVNNTVYKRLSMQGSGPQWRAVNGVGTIWVNESDAFDVQYFNQLSQPELIHAHGQTPPYSEDGVPYITGPPIPALSSSHVNFSVDLPFRGTFFVHSHSGLHYTNGVTAPLVTYAPLPPTYPNASLLNQAVDVIMVVEDFCPYNPGIGPQHNPSCFDVFTVYQSFVDHANNDTADALYPATINADRSVRDADLAINGGSPPAQALPFSLLQGTTSWANLSKSTLPLRAGFNFSECKMPANESHVSFRYHLANSKIIEEAESIILQPGQLVRLRIINAASMSNYYVDFGNTTLHRPAAVTLSQLPRCVFPYLARIYDVCVGGLQGTLIATDGHLILPDTASGYWISVSQRMDVILVVPSTPSTYLITATTEFSSAKRSGLVLVTNNQPPPAGQPHGIQTHNASHPSPTVELLLLSSCPIVRYGVPSLSRNVQQ
jgi:FtsP/CotA-like multicopper oxidase with cupredoxin domain